MIRSSVLTMALALLGIACAPTLLAETDAQQDTPADQSAPSEQSNPSYSDQELRSFAVALLEVERIKASYAPKLAETLRQQAQVKQAASLELLLALKQHGMSVDKYQEMLANVQSDPQLAGKVNEYLKSAPESKGDDSAGAQNNGAESSRPKSPDSDKARRTEQL